MPVPVGVPGELYIGGDGLARGYLNRPGLTAEKFVPNPFGNASSSRLYRTGDLVRYSSNGQIEFLNRIDHQVKIRGFRIELGEIEAVLAQHPDIREAVVVVREDAPGNKRLIGYLIGDNEELPTSNQIRLYLREKLPHYMIPDMFIFIDEFPLTPNKKVDRKALPIPDQIRQISESNYVEPRTPLEIELVNIWSDLLQSEQVGIHDNFFELGGHSLLITQVLTRLRRSSAIDLPLRSLFEYQTIAELATMIESKKDNGADFTNEQTNKDNLKDLLRLLGDF
jgi:acyl carrier protein